MTKYTNDAIGKRSKEKPGIDVVLGSQWGDEGKGKLVDMLSQVCMVLQLIGHCLRTRV